MENTKNPLALVIDFGSQSVRVGLVDTAGNIVALEKLAYNPVYHSKGPGLAEQDADFYWLRLIECAQKFSKKNQHLYPQVIGMTITCFRDTAVLLDKDIKPIRPCIHWLDQRMANPERKKIPLWKRFLFKVVGMDETVILNRQKTMALWYQQNEPENWAKTYRYSSLSAYINYLLCNNLSDSPSNFTGHYPINWKKGVWEKSGKGLKNVFSIPSEIMPELTNQGEIIGYISKTAHEVTGLPENTPIYASGSDKSCETLGVGALESDIGAISYGTSCTIEVTNKKYHEPEVFLPAYQACLPGYYNMDVQIYRGYWMLGWFSHEFAKDETMEAGILEIATEEVLNRKMLSIPPGCDGLVLQPYWGAGLKRPLARGSIIGFSDAHTRIHMYRAIVEGIAFALREGLESIQKSQHKKVRELRISGGGSQSDAICQITSDIFNLPVRRVQTFETTTLGGAVAVFLATKHFNTPEEAVKSMVHPSTAFTPDAVNVEKYHYLYKKVYIKLYSKLKGVYKDIKEFK